MAEESKSPGQRNVNYSSNSKMKKQAEAKFDRPLPKQIIPTGQAVKHKKSLARKFREQFSGDDAKSVGVYLLTVVIIPTVKNLIYDLGNEGLKRSLYGANTRPGAIGSAIGNTIMTAANRTSYSSYSRPMALSSSAPRNAANELTPQQRAMHDFSGIILQTREQAYSIIEVLSALIDDYEVATVNDFYACTGQTSEFTELKYGWKSMGEAQVRHVREGYLLELPRPVILD